MNIAAPLRTTRLWFGAILLACLTTAVGLVPVQADDAPSDQQQPMKKRSVLEKPLPDTIEELKEIQRKTRSVVEKVTPCTVGIEIGGASGSGVIVSEDGYVLTAGHVSGPPGKSATLIFPDGTRLKGKSLGKNDLLDSGMIKIEDPRRTSFPFVEMGDSKSLKKGQWCITLGHPRGYKEGRPPVVRVGRVTDSQTAYIISDCTLVGGDSGGPLFDFDGKLIGIHSRINMPITSNFHVPIEVYKASWKYLVAGESWRNRDPYAPPKPQEPYFGFRLDPDTERPLVLEVVKDSPVEKAGFQPKDVILKFENQEYTTRVELQAAIRKKKPKDEVTFEVERGSEVITLTVKVGEKPQS